MSNENVRIVKIGHSTRMGLSKARHEENLDDILKMIPTSLNTDLKHARWTHKLTSQLVQPTLTAEVPNLVVSPIICDSVKPALRSADYYSH